MKPQKLKIFLPFLTRWQLYINDDNLYQLTKTMNFFDILNAEEVWVVTDTINTKVVSGDERAVIFLSRNCDRQTSQPGVLVSCESGVYVQISIAEFSHVLSPSQKKAVESEDYQTLNSRELRSLAEIIAAVKIIQLLVENCSKGTVFGRN